MRFLACGDQAVLIELDDADHRRRLDMTLRRVPIDGVTEHVPADRTVLVLVDRPSDLPGVVDRLRSIDLDAVPEPGPASEPLRIEVTYDGPDLLDVAHHLGFADTEVVHRHTRQVWTVEFTGFAAGFGYLTGADHSLDVPRRPDPRTRIPAGSVGLAGPYSGVYPRDSPGGWQIIGRTTTSMWEPTRDPPALLTPGREVRFVQVDR